jgi:hypothetical protein
MHVNNEFTTCFDMICHVYVSPATNSSDNGWYYMRDNGVSAYPVGSGADAYGFLFDINNANIPQRVNYTLKQATIEAVEYNTTLNTSPSGDGVKFLKPDKTTFTL